MSSTSLYELFNTKVNCVAELGNSYGSAPAIWDYISNKLYGKDFNIFEATSGDSKFWSSYKDNRLSDNEKIVLLSTYDNSFVEVAHLVEFSSACKELHELIIDNTRWTWNHFSDIATAAKKLHDNHDRRCKGLAIGCTSVCDIWEQEDIKSIESWGVYEQLESLKSEAA